VTAELKQDIAEQRKNKPRERLTGILSWMDIPISSWYHLPVEPRLRRKPGPKPSPMPSHIEAWVLNMATENPWYGYKRIAVMCRRANRPVSNRQAYVVMKLHGLLKHRKRTKAALYQAKKLYELLPHAPNDLWQADVTYIHIPGHGWWYAVTVIDYYSRYLLACHLCPSYCAFEAVQALRLARAEAERIHGPLTKPPFIVTDNGSSFMARKFGEYMNGRFTHVRIEYRTPTQLGLLERFHRTLKDEEVCWRLYDNPNHCRDCLAQFRERYNKRRPHWALVPESGGDPYTPDEVYVSGHAIQIPKWQGWAREAKEKLDALFNAECNMTEKEAV